MTTAIPTRCVKCGRHLNARHEDEYQSTVCPAGSLKTESTHLPYPADGFGVQGFDLMEVSFDLVPVHTPLRNQVPRFP